MNLALTPLSAGGSSETTSSPAVEKPTVVVSIVPQAYVVDRIAGDLVETLVLVGPGQNPHSYEPTPRQMATLADADVWITSSTDFETALIPKIRSMYPDLLVIDGTDGVKFRTMEEHDHEAEDHQEEMEIHETNIDRHTWLGREPMKIMAKHIAEALTTIDGTHAPEYETKLTTFIAEIDGLFEALSQELSSLAGSTVFVYHPSFGYLFDEFGIIQKAVETGGKEPTAKNLTRLINEARAADVSIIFVQAQFPVNAARNVAEAIGAQVVPLDPLAYDWMENIRTIGETLKAMGPGQDQ